MCNVENYTKAQWRKTIDSKIYEKNRFECLELMRGLKKIDYNECSNEKFEMKQYFKTLNVSECRLRFKIKYFLTPTVSWNFKNDKVFKAQNYLCQDCLSDDVMNDSRPRGSINSQEHLMYECPANLDLKRGKSLDKTEDLVSFFKDLIERRQNKLNLAGG